MTLREAAEQGMTGTVLIVWSGDDQGRRNSLYHAEVATGHKTVCGRASVKWHYLTITIQELSRRVAERDNLCSECIRLLDGYDFSSGKEPSREPGRNTN